jgi:hypothetical protein
MKRRLLVVSYFYAPAIHPRSFRWTAITQEWAAAGHHVTVICARHPGEPSTKLMDGVHVHRVGTTLRGLLLGHKNAPASAAAVANRPGVSPWKHLAYALHRRTWKLVYWPDYACFWLFPALLAVWRHTRRNDHDAIYTVSWPFTCHVVGFIARTWLRKQSWIVDLGDPFAASTHVGTNNERLYGRLNRLAERAVIERAASVCIPTKTMLATYAQAYPSAASRMRYAAHLAPRPTAVSAPAVAAPAAATQMRQTLLFAGNLSPTGVIPDFCLRVFAAAARGALANRVSLHFVGNSLAVEASFRAVRDLEGTAVLRRPSAPHAEVLAAMADADVLVCIGSVSAMALPCKLMDYVSRGRPIIHFACNPDDPARAFLAAHPGALFLLDGPATPLAEHVRRFVAFLADPPPRLSEQEISGLLSGHGIETVAASYLAAAAPAGRSAAADRGWREASPGASGA